MVEPMQSDGGDIVPPKEYPKRLKETCDKFGILYVSDEVKVAPSRTGQLLGVDGKGVTPDGITLGKSIASGMPVGAMVAKEELLNGPFLSSTLSGNSISAAAGLATIQLLKQEKLLQNVNAVGQALVKRLEEMKERHQSYWRRSGTRLVRWRGVRKGPEDKATRQTRNSKDCLQGLAAGTNHGLRWRRPKRDGAYSAVDNHPGGNRTGSRHSGNRDFGRRKGARARFSRKRLYRLLVVRFLTASHSLKLQSLNGHYSICHP